MALKVGSLYVSLSANSSPLIRGFAEAAKAAEKLAKDVKKASNDVAQVAGTFAALGGAAVALAATVDGPTKRAVDGLKSSTQLLAVQVAEMLLPAVQEVTAMFHQAASVVAGMDAETKRNVASFAVLVVQVAAAAKVLSLFGSVGEQAAKAIGSIARVIAGIGVGPLLGVAAAVVGIASVVALLHRAWRQNWGDIQTITQNVLVWLQDAFGQVPAFFGKVWGSVVDGWSAVVELILDGAEKLSDALGLGWDVSGLREGFAGMAKDLKDGAFFSEAFKFGKTFGESLVDGVKEEWSLISEELGLDKLMAKVRGALSGGTPIGLGRGSGGIVSGAVVQSRAMGLDRSVQARKYVTEAGAEERSWLGGAGAGDWASVLEGQRDEVKRSGDALAGALATAAEVVDDQRKAVKDSVQRWAQAAEEAMEKEAAQRRAIVGMLVQGSGDLGRVIGNISQGAAAGGPFGAIIAAIMELLNATKSFGDFLGMAAYGLKRLGEFLEPLISGIFGLLGDLMAFSTEGLAPLFSALKPIFDGLTKFLGGLAPVMAAVRDLFEGLAPIIEAIASVVGKVLAALRPLFDLIAGVIKLVATVVLGIVIALNEIAAAFGDAAARAEADRLSGIVNRMWGPNADAEAKADMEAAGAAWRLASGADGAAAAVRGLTESLTNVPSGYKLASMRFEADLGSSPMEAFAETAYGSSGGLTVNGDVIVTGQAITDTEALGRAIEKEARKGRGMRTGNPQRLAASGGWEG